MPIFSFVYYVWHLLRRSMLLSYAVVFIITFCNWSTVAAEIELIGSIKVMTVLINLHNISTEKIKKFLPALCHSDTVVLVVMTQNEVWIWCLAAPIFEQRTKFPLCFLAFLLFQIIIIFEGRWLGIQLLNIWMIFWAFASCWHFFYFSSLLYLKVDDWVLNC